MYRIPPSGVCVQMYVCTRELSQGAVSGFNVAGVRLPPQRSCSYQP